MPANDRRRTSTPAGRMQASLRRRSGTRPNASALIDYQHLPACRRDFCSVAEPATTARLPLRPVDDLEQESVRGLDRRLRQLLVRGSSSVGTRSLAAAISPQQKQRVGLMVLDADRSEPGFSAQCCAGGSHLSSARHSSREGAGLARSGPGLLQLGRDGEVQRLIIYGLRVRLRILD